MPTWMTVDADDLRHLPKHQGHPTRSTTDYTGTSEKASPSFRLGWSGFLRWMGTHDGIVTLFVITDALEDTTFCDMLAEAIDAFPDRLTVGCHGHSHRSWSAWGEDVDGFRTMLIRSTELLRRHAGTAFRPYFRAPNGYVAPWMAAVLFEQGYKVDTSVNPSWLVKAKANGAAWSDVIKAMSEAGVVERAWLTHLTLPVNGPALFRFPLSLIARGAWRKTPPLLKAGHLGEVENPHAPITTVYCHVLDFARDNGTWTPPLPRHRAK